MPLAQSTFPIEPDVERLVADARNPPDLLLRLLKDKVVAQLLLNQGVDLMALGREVESRAEGMGEDRERTQEMLNHAIGEARLMTHQRVGTIHLLMALLYRDTPETAEPLTAAGVTLYDLRTHLQSARGRRDLQTLWNVPLPSLRGHIRPSGYFLLPVGAWLAGGLLLAQVPSGITLVAGMALFVLGGWITQLCLHEFGHAVVGFLGGDRSVAAAGYLTLNPRRYTHVVLSLVIPTVFILLGGVGLPGGAVYINRNALRSRGWSAAVSAAGPLVSLAFALVCALPFMLGAKAFIDIQPALAVGFAYLAFLVMCAVVFNIIPIPPLDGWGVVASFLSWETRARGEAYGTAGIWILFLLLWWTPLGPAFFTEIFRLVGMLAIPPLLAYDGQQILLLRSILQQH